MTIVKRRKGADWVKTLVDGAAWGFGGGAAAKSASSPPLIDLAALGVPQALWLPGVAGNYVSTLDVNEVDYDSSTLENGVGRWEGLNKNILTANQSSLETDTVGWLGSGTTIARSTAQSFTGAASLAVTRSGTVGSAHMYANTGVPVVPNQVYTAVVHSRAASSPRRLLINLLWYNSSGTHILTSPGQLVANNTAGWTQNTLVAQAPAAAFTVRFDVHHYDCNPGETHYVDGVGLFETPNGNLVPDSDFESQSVLDTPSVGVSQVFSTDRAYTGRTSALITWTTASSNGTSGAVKTVSSLIVGATYTASVWLYAPSGSGSAAPAVRIWGLASGTPVTAMDNWVRSVLTFTATSTTHQIAVIQTGGSTAGQQVYVDGFQIVAGSAPVDYLPPTTHNLWRHNPGVTTTEQPLNGNVGSGGVLSEISTVRSYFGTQSERVSAPTGSGYLGKSRALSDLVPGQRYTLSLWVYTDNTDTSGAARSLFWYNFGGTLTTVAQSMDQPSGAWSRIWLTFIPGGTSLTVSLCYSSSTSTVSYLDGFQLELGNVATPYVDGSLGAGYAWDTSDNLIANPSFETDTSGWEGLTKNLLSANQSSVETDTTGLLPAANCTIARSTAQAFTGTASLALTAQAAGAMNAGTPWVNADAIPIVPGQVYTISAMFRAAVTAREVSMIFRWNDAAGNSLSFVEGPRVADHSVGWTQATFTMQAPANAVFASIRVQVQGAAAGEIHYVDAIGLIETPNGNLEAASDMESYPPGWGSIGATTASFSVEEAYVGRGSMKIVAAGNGHVFRQSQISRTCLPETTYTASMYVKITSGASVNMLVELWTAGGAYLGNAPSATVANGAGWTRLTATFTTGATTERYNISINTQGVSTFYIDAVQVVAGSGPVEYLPRTTTNLCTNPSAEVDLNGWAGVGGSLTRVTSGGLFGSSAFRMTSAGSGPIYPKMVDIPIQGPGTITVSAYIKDENFAATSAQVYIYFRYGNAAENTTDAARVGPVYTPTTSGWTRVSHTRTMPSNVTHVGFILYTNGNGAAGTSVLIDGWQAEFGSVPTPYVDGSLGAGYSWEASENLHVEAVAEGTTGWFVLTNANTVVVGDTAQSRSGGSSVSWLSNVAGHTAIYSVYPGSTTDNPISGPVPGATYTHSAYVFSPVATQAYMRVQYDFVTSGGRQDGPMVDVPANTWTRIVHTTVCPPWNGTNGNGPETRTEPSVVATAANQKFYADNIQVEGKPYATPYGQTGTAHANSSTRMTPWVLGGTSLERISRSANQVAHGSNSMLVRGPSKSEGYSELLVLNKYASGISTLCSVAPLTTYTVAANMFFGSQGRFEVRSRQTGKTFATVDLTGGVGRRALTFTTDASTTQIEIRILVTAWGTVAYTNDWFYVYIDAVQLEQRSYATPYGQTGTAHAATSTRRQPWVLGGTSIESVTSGFNFKREGARGLGVNRPARSTTLPDLPFGAGLECSVVPGQIYTASAYAAGQGSASVRWEVINLSTFGVIAAGAAADAGAVSGEGARRVLTFTAPAGCTKVRLQMVSRPGDWYINGVGGFLDAVQLERAGSVTPHTLPLRITGDLDIRAHLALEDWTPATKTNLVGRWMNTYCYLLSSEGTTGRLVLDWQESDGTARNAGSTTAVPFTDGSAGYVRATLDVSNASGFYEVRFYTSTDGIAWTQLGATVTGTTGTNLKIDSAAGPAPVQVGARDLVSSGTIKGKVLSAEIRAGIDGTVVTRYDATAYATDSPNLLLGHAASFEDGGTGGWANFGGVGTLSNGTAGAVDGARALAITFGASPVVVNGKIASLQNFTAEAGVTYTVSATVTVPVGSSIRIGLENVLSGPTSHAGTGSPMRVTQTITVGATSVKTSGPLLNAGTSGIAANSVIYVDAVQIEKASTASPFKLSSRDTTGKAWTISRSSDATTEIVDRNTFAFTGGEYLTVTDKNVLDIALGQDFTAAVSSLSRENQINDTRFGKAVANGQWAIYSGWGNSSFVRVQDSVGTAGQTPAQYVSPGVWGTTVGGREGDTLFSQIDAQAKVTTNDATNGVFSNSGHVYLGSGTRGLISWAAFFRRALSVIERDELAAWNGRVATEPTWLRSSAVLYVNADDPIQTAQYTATNSVVNLATPPAQRKVAGSFLPQVVLRRKNGAWV